MRGQGIQPMRVGGHDPRGPLYMSANRKQIIRNGDSPIPK